MKYRPIGLPSRSHPDAVQHRVIELPVIGTARAPPASPAPLLPTPRSESVWSTACRSDSAAGLPPSPRRRTSLSRPRRRRRFSPPASELEPLDRTRRRAAATSGSASCRRFGAYDERLLGRFGRRPASLIGPEDSMSLRSSSLRSSSSSIDSASSAVPSADAVWLVPAGAAHREIRACDGLRSRYPRPTPNASSD